MERKMYSTPKTVVVRIERPILLAGSDPDEQGTSDNPYSGEGL